MKIAELAGRLNSHNIGNIKLPPIIMVTDIMRFPDPFSAAKKLPPDSAILLRDYNLNHRTQIAFKLANFVKPMKLKLFIAGDPKLAIKVGADGVHFPEKLIDEVSRWRYRKNWTITVSAHSKVALKRAEMSGADAALLSPVFKTSSHPNTRPLGISKFSTLVHGSGIPVYAMGGINNKNAQRLIKTPAVGIAAITALYT